MKCSVLFRPICKYFLRSVAFSSLVVGLLLCQATQCLAAISWDADAGTPWWYDYVNWASTDNPADPLTEFLIPTTNAGGDQTDIQINIGTTGEGVVLDPDNDPFFGSGDADGNGTVNGADLLELQRTGAPAMSGNWQRQYGGAGYAAADMYFPEGGPFDINLNTGETRAGYDPQTFYRLYISRGTTNSNTLTIKSGDIAIMSTTIIGRSGSSLGSDNLGRIVQEGGALKLPNSTLDLGQSEDSGWGNGEYDYRGGILEVQQVGGTQGIRVGAGRSSGVGNGRFIMHNPTSGGYVRTFDMTFVSERIAADAETRGVGVVEFHFENGGTRPIQIDRNLTINNGADPDEVGAVRSSRLELVLNEAPSTDGGVPQDLGLFDVDFGGLFGGAITGTGDLNGDEDYINDRVFSNADNTAGYYEGDTVSAIFDGVQYDWTISYTGDISWSDADNSVVDQILGPGNGTDVVLIGLSSSALLSAATVPEPSSLMLVSAGALLFAGRRRR